uniref:Uncharacterized protein n=1 Tax=Rhizophora mucronata TaxID=61149 RepID=A0A2P2N9P6_RHIMU
MSQRSRFITLRPSKKLFQTIKAIVCIKQENVKMYLITTSF